MSTALALHAPARSGALARFGSGMALQTLAGSVSAFFALESFDRRRGVAIYALHVVNRTMAALICRTWIVSREGDAMLAYPVAFEVEPLSTSSTQIPVWPKDFPSFDRALAEVAGDGVHCIVEAAVPPRSQPRVTYARLAAACLMTGMVALGAAAALRSALPRIAAFAVPPETLAGTTVSADYDASGAGRLSYSVTAPDGRRLQGADLPDHSGTLRVAIPASNDAGAYTLQMVMAGPLGSAKETRVLNTLAAHGPGSAQIQDVTVTPAVAKPGQRIDVAYAAAGDGGYVRLLGADGTIWAQEPFSHGGQTQLVVPAVPTLREMRVLVHVNRGRSIAQSMAGLAVAAPAARADANAGTAIAGDDETGAGASSASANENGTFELLTPTVKSGGTIRVRIISPRDGMRISLMDSQSREVTGLTLGAEADVITLQAPAVAIPTRYTVVAGFTDGFGQESVVQPVTVTP
ncbi:MAG TPA: hypothetical protein VMT95_05225 [Candidatus Binatia bacterium]|nr:hypothetical protein [Candidatus Binatia bacterium]